MFAYFFICMHKDCICTKISFLRFKDNLHYNLIYYSNKRYNDVIRSIFSHVYSKLCVSFGRIWIVTKICLLYSIHLDWVTNDSRFVFYVPLDLIVVMVRFGMESTDELKLLVPYTGFNSR